VEGIELGRTEKVNLAGGQVVTLTRYGAPSASATVLYLHGFPGSRLEGSLAHATAASLGMEVIAVDRPGFGRSTDSAGRAIADFPATIEALAAALGLSRFSILAVSGGAPYALACGAMLPSRVKAVAIVSGMGPIIDQGSLRGMVLPNRILLAQAKALPRFTYLLALLMASWWRSFPTHMVYWLSLLLRGDDRRILAQPEVRRFLTQNVAEALALGVQGAARELILLSRPWGFPFEAIRAPTTFWHGEADSYVPIGLAEQTCQMIPHATLRRVPEKGHFMALDIIPEVLAGLKALGSSR
jgi:pimeloyl-ACP methyl ester carboxylesterase